MQKWEYTRVLTQPTLQKIEVCRGSQSQSRKDMSIDEVLKDLGEHGWELVGYVSDTNSAAHTMIFKRLKES